MGRTNSDWHRKYVSTPSGRISYVERGEGRVALFIHGVLVNGYLWRHQLAELAGDRRCIAIDLLAHGGSEASPEQDMSFEAQAEMLSEFLDALKISKVDLVANDSGVGIAQIFAVNHTSKLRSLVLTNGDVHDNWPPKEFSGFLDMVAAGGLAATLGRMLADKNYYRGPEAFGPAYECPSSIADETIEAYLRPHVASSERTHELERFILAFNNSQTVKLEARLKTLTVPTRIVWGTGDIFFNRRWAEWLETTIPNARQTTFLKGATLLFPEERPDELNAELREFWNLVSKLSASESPSESLLT